MSKEFIKIGGAREHNLKNLSLQIPRDKLVVVTGLSGSGKSSLAFDTIYAEGQRKYVESLSAYARQFLDQLQKPDVDFIEGFRRPSRLSSEVPAAARARSSPPPRKFTITCACCTRTSARRIVRKPACPFPRKAPATSWTKSSRCRRKPRSCCSRRSCAGKRASFATSLSGSRARASCACAWMGRLPNWRKHRAHQARQKEISQHRGRRGPAGDR